jgi:hypothetical protein
MAATACSKASTVSRSPARMVAKMSASKVRTRALASVGVVAADRTGLFRGSQAAVAGRKADVDAPGQFGNGQVPVLLQFTNGRHTGQGMLPILIDASVPNA